MLSAPFSGISAVYVLVVMSLKLSHDPNSQREFYFRKLYAVHTAAAVLGNDNPHPLHLAGQNLICIFQSLYSLCNR